MIRGPKYRLGVHVEEANKMSNPTPAFVCMVILAVIVASPAAGEPPVHSPTNEVQQAVFERAERQEPRSTVTFGRRSPRVGDRVEQAIALEMRLTTSLRQGNQILEKKHMTMRSQQRRVVTTTNVNQARADAVEVKYLKATKQIDAAEPVQPAADAPGASQPVEGKTYRCRREGGEDGKLVVTDAAGHLPPTDEYEIVAQNMDMVGRSNPLAEFLAGRTLAAGQTVTLPNDVAGRLFNLEKRYGEVERFDLTLEKLPAQDGAACAVFLARVEAASNDSSQMRLDVEGPLVVEVATCRVVRMSLSGPMGLSETRGSYSMAQQLLGMGQLKMSLASAYRDAQR